MAGSGATVPDPTVTNASVPDLSVPDVSVTDLSVTAGPTVVGSRAGGPDRAYEDLLGKVLHTGVDKDDRTGTGTVSSFGERLEYDLTKGFPLVTTKRVHFRSVAAELLWFLRGDSNVGWLHDQGVSIWDEWADESGDLGPVYGVQWRSWPSPDEPIDQLAGVLRTLTTDPDSRRMVVSAWNPVDIPRMALAPCHVLFQFYVAAGQLSCQVYQRSADLFLGVPFNIASYALLTHLVAQQTGLGVGRLVWVGGDCHVYQNHLAQVRTQLARAPYPFPQLRCRAAASLFEYTLPDLELVGYRHHPAIPAPVAV